MKKSVAWQVFHSSVLGCCFLLISGKANAQLTIVSDNFSGNQQFIDNSKTILWAGYSSPESAFEVNNIVDNQGLTYPALQLTDSAKVYANYHALSNSTKALTCIDYHFGTFDRSNDTLWIEFDVLWERITNSGEAGRINAMLLHAYPPGGARFGEVDSIRSGIHPFGRPAYHFRVRNRNPALGNGFGFMGYGGNNDTLGKLYIHSAAGVPKHWLPGAVPVSGSFPPTFPDGGAVELLAMASATEWRRIIWTITPSQIAVSWKKSGSNNVPNLISLLPTPASSTAPHYKYFRYLEAFRLYLYGAGENIFVANLKITGTTMPVITTTLPQKPEKDVRFYPNPVAKILNIELQEPDAFMSIFTPTGKQVLSEKLTGVKNSLDVSNLNPGLYLLSIQNSKRNFVQILIKE